jgi:hypothetical protein
VQGISFLMTTPRTPVMTTVKQSLCPLAVRKPIMICCTAIISITASLSVLYFSGSGYSDKRVIRFVNSALESVATMEYVLLGTPCCFLWVLIIGILLSLLSILMEHLILCNFWDTVLRSWSISIRWLQCSSRHSQCWWLLMQNTLLRGCLGYI